MCELNGFGRRIIVYNCFKYMDKGTDQICPGDLIFNDDFNSLDLNKWKHEETLNGGGNNEFQWYTNSRENTFTRGGNLHIKPTLTSDIYGEPFLSSGTIKIDPSKCTAAWDQGCERTGTPEVILNPIRSARIGTINSFNVKYGRIVFRAKISSGDWLWPALWLLPKSNDYGPGTLSGEIDVMETRGNKNLMTTGGGNIGSEQVASALHFGPADGYRSIPSVKDRKPGFELDFHTYEVVWTPDYIKFKVDNEEIGTLEIDSDGLWKKVENNQNKQNPWSSGGKAAPFDKEFYIILNLAVGGNAFFADNTNNLSGKKPWINNSPTSLTDFWNGRSKWLPTWNYKINDNSHFQIDYVKVYAI